MYKTDIYALYQLQSVTHNKIPDDEDMISKHTFNHHLIATTWISKHC